MVNVKNLGSLAINGAKVAVAFLGAISVAEAGVIGASSAVADVKCAEKCIKHTINPTPVKVKEPGLFGKKKVVKINPVTGRIKEYTGDKEPVNKKAIKLVK